MDNITITLSREEWELIRSSLLLKRMKEMEAAIMLSVPPIKDAQRLWQKLHKICSSPQGEH